MEAVLTPLFSLVADRLSILTELTSPSATDKIYVVPSGGSGRYITRSNLLGGSTVVNSVSNVDGTLTISPTTGAVVASLNLANANTWTATQNFVAPASGRAATFKIAAVSPLSVVAFLNSSGSRISEVTSTGAFSAPDGSATAPGFSFLAGSDTGFFTVSGAEIRIAVGGTHYFTADTSGLFGTTAGWPYLQTSAAVTAPPYAFVNDTNTGFYTPAADTIGFALGGTLTAKFERDGTTLTPVAQTSGSPTLVTLTGPAHTTLTASTEATDVNLNLARTVQFSTGALTTQRAFRIQAPTYAFVAASTITTAATLAISGAPVAGTNATITNAYALWVQAGRSFLNGPTTVGNSTNTAALTIKAWTQDITIGAASGSGIVGMSSAARLYFTASNFLSSFRINCIGNSLQESLTLTENANLCLAYNYFGRSAEGTTNRNVGRFTTEFADATDATRTGRLKFETYYTTTAQEAIRVDSASDQARVAIGGNILSGVRATIYTGVAADKGLVLSGAASQSGNLFEAQNSSGTAYVTVGPPTLANDGTQNWLSITGTFPSGQTADDVFALNVVATSAGSHSFRHAAARVSLAAGYTGGARTTAGSFTNAAAGTGANVFGVIGNIGLLGNSNATTAGHNVGTYALVSNGNLNYALFAQATTAKDSATNVGVAGFALNTGTNSTQVGGYFGLQASTPVFSSSALIADNGSTTSSIFVARDNGTTVLTVADGGDVTIAPVVRTTGSPTLFTLTGPAHTTLTSGTEATDINLNLARTVQFATSTPTTQRAFRIQAPTYSCDTASQTITTGVTLDVSGAPAAGTNVTITNQIGARFNAGVAAGIPIVAQGAGGQTGDLQQWRNSSGTVLARIDSLGCMSLNQGTAPGGLSILSFAASSNFNSASTISGITGLVINSGLGEILGVNVQAESRGAGTVTSVTGIRGSIRSNGASTVITTGITLNAVAPLVTQGSITNTYGVRIQNQGLAGVTNAYGLYVDAQSGASTINYAAIFAGGNVGIGETAPGAQLQVTAGAAGTIGQILKAAGSQTANLLEVRNSSGTAYVTIGPPTLAGDSATKNWINLTATMPTTLTAACTAIYSSITTAGSSAQDVTGIGNYLLAGYTGGNTVIASYASNAVAGTGASTLTGGAGNYGFYGIASATTAGDNVGGFFKANGGNLSVGVTGCANVNKASAVNVGVIGIGQNGGAGANHIGGLFQIGQNSVPAVSAGLVVTNGSFVAPIALFRDDTVTVLTIADGGDVTIAPVVRTTGSPTLFTLTGPAHTTLTASTEATDFDLNLARTVQFAAGTLTTQRAVRLRAPTYAFASASTLTNAITFEIDGGPLAGTNATLTNSMALRILTGADANIGAVIKANSGTQTGDLFQAQNSSASVLFRLTKLGIHATTKTSITLAAAATTFAITSNVMAVTGDAGANTIATITGAPSGTILVLIFTNDKVTITDTNTPSTDTVNLSAAFTSAAGTTLTLARDGTSWYEVARSVNGGSVAGGEE